MARQTLCILLVVAAIGASPCMAAGDAKTGADAFDGNCSDCHSVSSKVANRKGPSLFKVVGRKAGAVPGFKYSAQLAGSGVVWDAAKLDAYLTNPKAMFPAGTMKFKGLAKPQERQDIIAFLAAQH